jgi:hypothetical protein
VLNNGSAPRCGHASSSAHHRLRHITTSSARSPSGANNTSAPPFQQVPAPQSGSGSTE